MSPDVFNVALWGSSGLLDPKIEMFQIWETLRGKGSRFSFKGFDLYFQCTLRGFQGASGRF